MTVLLFLAIKPVRIPSITRRHSPKLHWLHHFSPLNHSQQSYCLTPHYWDFLRPTLFPTKIPYWRYGVSFAFLNPVNGTSRLSRNFGEKLPLLAAGASNHAPSFVYFLQENSHIGDARSTSVGDACQTSHVRRIFQLASVRKNPGFLEVYPTIRGPSSKALRPVLMVTMPKQHWKRSVRKVI